MNRPEKRTHSVNYVFSSNNINYLPKPASLNTMKPEPSLNNLNISVSSKTESNHILLRLEKEGYTTPDAKAKELITRNLANHSLFDHHSKEIITRLEFHLRAWAASLEQICFSEIVLIKELRDKIYNSLAKFAEFHRKNIQVIEEGFDSLRSKFNPSNQQYDEDSERIKKHNYNIDFLLIHLRDTLHSLRDDETWYQEILRRTKELLKTVLNIAPGITSIVAPGVALPNDNCSILSMLTRIRQGLSFKYPVATYYVDWRIMLIIQHNLFIWSESDENIIGRKFGERILMEYLWIYSEREWNNFVDKTILDSQTKLDEVSNKLVKALRNTGSFLNDLAGNEPFALPDMLWFGMLDLAQNLIKKFNQPAIYGLCYYLAIKSLNKAPNSFIQFKAIEILLYLQNINESFSIVKLDFDEYAQKLYDNNNSSDSSEKFQNLLAFVKEKCHEDLIMLNNDIGNGKGTIFEQNTYFKQEQTSDPFNILDAIVNGMTCSISQEPEGHLCILITKTIYKNLYSHLISAGHVLPSIELKHSENNQHEDDCDNSEVDHILIKKTKHKELNLNSNKLRPKKQRPAYQYVIKELTEKNYESAISMCQEYVKANHKSYTMKCILAYAYRCINNYEQALSYLEDAIKLKENNPIAYFIRGEILFRQGYYENAIQVLERSKNHNKSMILLGNSYYSKAENVIYDKEDNYDNALRSYKLALQKDSKNYLCLKYCAHIYKIQGRYLEALEMLDKLLEINQLDSLILCYYGEILNYLEKYNDSISHFSRAYHIDPENTHILFNKAITHYELREYENALSELNELIQLDSSNSLAYFYKGLIYYALGNDEKTKIEVKRCISFFNSGDHLAKFLLYYLNLLFDDSFISGNILNNYLMQEYSDTKLWSFLSDYFKISDNDFIELGIINEFHKLMYKVLSYENEVFPIIILPKLCSNSKLTSCYVTWKINVEKLLTKNCYVKFIVEILDIYSDRIICHELILTHEDVSELVGLGWIEYTLPFEVNKWVQPSIDLKNKSIIMIIYIPKKEDPLQIYKFHPNVPKVFNDKYFSKKEMENLIELTDIKI
ncbi:5003_t:CDS:2 [Funneliformis caledonium]|uniref:5003_t:CDS:1 n=1 Tax=Funneliformis caledonium TaxID=1117310 RepID=A0A9N9GCW2_9GLOM|nr:5003_t:CDS:2 [Funneliformis caledonium]